MGLRILFYVRNTLKVGDTINAIIDPVGATDPTFAWAADGTPILGATTASYVVGEADLGKKISVTVTGVDGQTFTAETAAVTAAPTDKIAIVSAKQSGSATFEAVFNKPINTAEYDITVTRGATAQTITTVLDEAATTASMTLGTAVQTADYTITITNKTDATDTATTTVKGEAAELKSIDFLGDQLILTDSGLKKAATTLVGYNQYDEQVTLTGSLTLTSTKGTATYSQADNKVKVECGESIFFTVGGTTILQVSKPLTVSSQATLTKFELGDVTTTKTALKDAKINLTNLATNTYYFPVKAAEDQYGNKLSAKELDTMMIKADETDPTADGYGNLYITPNQLAGSYAYVTGFEELSDKTIAMKVSLGGLKSPGTAVFSMTGVSGYQGTAELVIEDDPFIAVLTVSAPTFYADRSD